MLTFKYWVNVFVAIMDRWNKSSHMRYHIIKEVFYLVSVIQRFVFFCVFLNVLFCVLYTYRIWAHSTLYAKQAKLQTTKMACFYGDKKQLVFNYLIRVVKIVCTKCFYWLKYSQKLDHLERSVKVLYNMQCHYLF